ncbi:MAG: MotA/TolQ/ExbB proton channel family protein [Planctomycetota bacterium]|nr:MotA/TolQ/ExbB proton channel family protein [Planctomycetota bacterium]
MTHAPYTLAQGGLDVWSLVWEAGPMAKFVLLTLLIFSFASWTIMLDRLRRFRRAEDRSRRFLEIFRKGEGLAKTHERTKQIEGSPLADIFRAGFRELSLNPPPQGSAVEGPALEALHRTLRKTASLKATDLEQRLGFLATTASATPFIGLFGTVWGIMNAFRGIGVSGTASLAAYAPGIAEALVATAAGLLAAIPAVIFYNHFLGRLRSMDARIDEFVADLIHRIQGRRA